MKLIYRFVHTYVMMVCEDKQFIQSLKYVFARGLENHKLHVFKNADNLLDHIKNKKIHRLDRLIFVIPISVHLKNSHENLHEIIETLKNLNSSTHIILIYNNEEVGDVEIEGIKTELMIDDIILKDNYTKYNIQNVVRRIVSNDNYVIRRNLLYFATVTTIIFGVLSVLLFFFS